MAHGGRGLIRKRRDSDLSAVENKKDWGSTTTTLSGRAPGPTPAGTILCLTVCTVGSTRRNTQPHNGAESHGNSCRTIRAGLYSGYMPLAFFHRKNPFGTTLPEYLPGLLFQWCATVPAYEAEKEPESDARTNGPSLRSKTTRKWTAGCRPPTKRRPSVPFCYQLRRRTVENRPGQL